MFGKLFRRRPDPGPDLGECESCHRTFEYQLLHNGFGDTAYAYCDRCGMIALLNFYSQRPAGAPLRVHGPIDRETERWLESCSCGGSFRRDASPRCPHCTAPLSAELATRYIEKNAPGTRKGWRWQRSWLGLYAIAVEGRMVSDNWREAPPAE